LGFYDDFQISFDNTDNAAVNGVTAQFINNAAKYGDDFQLDSPGCADGTFPDTTTGLCTSGAALCSTLFTTTPTICVGGTPLCSSQQGIVQILVPTGAVNQHCSVTYTWGTTVGESQNTPPGSGGDPQFWGFLGQSYQVHGVSGTVYNVISTPSLQLNALFTFLTEGRCRKGTLCFGHPGNYFGEVGLMLKDDSQTESNLRVIAGPVDVGLQVLVNGTALSLSSSSVSIGSTSVMFTDPFEVSIITPEFSFRMVNSDMFLNEDVSINEPLMNQILSFKRAAKSGTANVDALPHGLLGQSWQSKTYANRWKYIEGSLFDYAVADGVFGTQFKYNRF